MSSHYLQLVSYIKNKRPGPHGGSDVKIAINFWCCWQGAGCGFHTVLFQWPSSLNHALTCAHARIYHGPKVLVFKLRLRTIILRLWEGETQFYDFRLTRSRYQEVICSESSHSQNWLWSRNRPQQTTHMCSSPNPWQIYFWKLTITPTGIQPIKPATKKAGATTPATANDISSSSKNNYTSSR